VAVHDANVNERQHKYITSERFIHDNLVRICQGVVDEAKRLWEAKIPLDGHALTWPSAAIKDDSGSLIDRAVIMEMPERSEWKKALASLVERTKAYGLFLIEADDKKISAVFESMHGSRSWVVPIERHGDRLVLGDQRTKDDVDSIGLLWSPKRGNA
jgi:hypothetical protein